MTAVPLIAAAILTLAGLACGWAWLICLGRGAERLAAHPAAGFAVALFLLAVTVARAAMAHNDAACIITTAANSASQNWGRALSRRCAPLSSIPHAHLQGRRATFAVHQ
ncbi:hypothetical protein [Reyranella sp.]|uniref:hypothetical protein n=1 Tax=Reyranella sp. TaxID=1929291 RepID=UPI003C7B38D8